MLQFVGINQVTCNNTPKNLSPPNPVSFCNLQNIYPAKTQTFRAYLLVAGAALKNIALMLISMMRKILNLFFLFVIFTFTLSQETGDKPCSKGFECVERDECEHYKAEIQRSKEVTKKSKE